MNGVLEANKGSKIGHMAKLAWPKLKEEYISGDTDSVSAFLKEKGIRRSGYVSRVTRGWNEARWSYQAKLRVAKEEENIKRTSRIDAEFNAKRLKVARNLQFKALRALQYQEPETVNQSVRMLEIGLEEEREATGINDKDALSAQPESIYLKTRFAKELKEALLKMNDEEFSRLLAGIMGNSR